MEYTDKSRIAHASNVFPLLLSFCFICAKPFYVKRNPLFFSDCEATPKILSYRVTSVKNSILYWGLKMFKILMFWRVFFFFCERYSGRCEPCDV